MESLNVIPWDEFTYGISPLWKQTNPNHIPIYNNPFGLIQYELKNIAKKIIYFPCKYQVNNETVGYISIYNISDVHIRPRGIYILPRYQGQGLGHRMQKAAWDLFPISFYRAFIITSQVERFCKNSQMSIFPNVPSLWSQFGQVFLTLLYYQRSHFPTLKDIESNRLWIDSKLDKFGLGGTNNLNVNFTDEEWLNYFSLHKGNYSKLTINLDN